MLLSMLLGNETIYVADDRIFQQISVLGQLQDYITKIRTTTRISDSAMDLLQQLLRYDPKDQPTLRDVYHHPCIIG
jgi:serine/threonine protein kinase